MKTVSFIEPSTLNRVMFRGLRLSYVEMQGSAAEVVPLRVHVPT